MVIINCFWRLRKLAAIRNVDWLLHLACPLGAASFHGKDHVHALRDLTKYRVLAIQEGRVCCANEELVTSAHIKTVSSSIDLRWQLMSTSSAPIGRCCR